MVHYFCALTHVAALGLIYLFIYFLRGSTLGIQAWRVVHPDTVTALMGGQ